MSTVRDRRPASAVQKYLKNLKNRESQSLVSFRRQAGTTRNMAVEESMNVIESQHESLIRLARQQAGMTGWGSAIPSMSTMLSSVCLLLTDFGNIGTGFLMNLPGLGIVFATAGHNFRRNRGLPDEIDFSKYSLYFGYVKGDPGGEGTLKSCKLSDFGEFRGSIGLGGFRRYFPGNITRPSRPREDYAFFVLPESAFQKKKKSVKSVFKSGNGGLKKWWDDGGLLKFGQKNYLERETEGDPLVIVCGHPYVQDVGCGFTPDGYPEFRISIGREKYPADQDISPDHHIFYDNETLGGNSGSPVIGFISLDGQYEVKGIHIQGTSENKKLNSAQGLMHWEEWLKPQATPAPVPINNLGIIDNRQLNGSRVQGRRRSRKNKRTRERQIKKNDGAHRSDSPAPTTMQSRYSAVLRLILLVFLILVPVISALFYHL